MKSNIALCVFLFASSAFQSAYSFTSPSFFGSRAGTHHNFRDGIFGHNFRQRQQHGLYARRPPSKVDESDVPTPPLQSDPVKIIDVDTIPELKYDRGSHAVADQPWRRGDTDGCEDPIYSPWRIEAEAIITEAVEAVGAELHGITWGMSQLMVSLHDVSRVEGIIDGPEIIVDVGDDYDENLGPDLHWNPTLSQDEFEEYIDTHPRSVVTTLQDPMSDPTQDIDTMALSTVAEAVTTALAPEEHRLHILDRHELLLTSPSNEEGVLESQKDFDAHRGYHVQVETRDPFKSNRTLKGKLVNRNALDVVINVNGRMVTIPQNFVYQVSLDDDFLEE